MPSVGDAPARTCARPVCASEESVTLLSSLRWLAALHRLVLMAWLLSLSVAWASPIVHLQFVELVCSAGGAVKVLVQEDDDASEAGTVGVECPLCVAACMPSARAAQRVAQPLPLGRAPRSIPAARLAAATAAPLPARGPPALC